MAQITKFVFVQDVTHFDYSGKWVHDRVHGQETHLIPPGDGIVARLLFGTWETTQDVEAACRTARVCRQTFRNWKRGFAAGAYMALEHFVGLAPKELHRTPPAVAERVLALRRTAHAVASELAVPDLGPGERTSPPGSLSSSPRSRTSFMS